MSLVQASERTLLYLKQFITLSRIPPTPFPPSTTEPGYTVLERTLSSEGICFRLAYSLGDAPSPEAVAEAAAWFDARIVGDVVDIFCEDKRWRVGTVTAVGAGVLTVMPRARGTGGTVVGAETVARGAVARRLAALSVHTRETTTGAAKRPGDELRLTEAEMADAEARMDAYLNDTATPSETYALLHSGLSVLVNEILNSEVGTQWLLNRLIRGVDTLAADGITPLWQRVNDGLNDRIAKVVSKVLATTPHGEAIPPDVLETLRHFFLLASGGGHFWGTVIVHHELVETDIMRYSNGPWATICPEPTYYASGSWVHCVNTFTAAGGFDAILSRLRAQIDAARIASNAPPPIDAAATAALIAAEDAGGDPLADAALFASCARAVKLVCTKGWAMRYFAPLRDVIFERLRVASPATLRRCARDSPDTAISHITGLWSVLCTRSAAPLSTAERIEAARDPSLANSLSRLTEPLTLALAARNLSLNTVERGVKALSDAARVLESAIKTSDYRRRIEGQTTEALAAGFGVTELLQSIPSSGLLEALFALPAASVHASVVTRAHGVLIPLARASAEAVEFALNKAIIEGGAAADLGDDTAIAIGTSAVARGRLLLGTRTSVPLGSLLTIATADGLWRLVAAQAAFDDGRRAALELVRNIAPFAPLAVILSLLRGAASFPLSRYDTDVLSTLSALTHAGHTAVMTAAIASAEFDQFEKRLRIIPSPQAALFSSELSALLTNQNDAPTDASDFAAPLLWRAALEAGANDAAGAAVRTAAASALEMVLLKGGSVPLMRYTLEAAKRLHSSPHPGSGVSPAAAFLLLERLLRAPATSAAVTSLDAATALAAAVIRADAGKKVKETAHKVAASYSLQSNSEIIGSLVADVCAASTAGASIEALSARLRLLEWLGAALLRPLTTSEVDALWRSLVPRGGEISEYFFFWLRSAHCNDALATALGYTSQAVGWGRGPLLQSSTLAFAFDTLFLTPTLWNPHNAGPEATETFYYFLIAFNASLERIEPMPYCAPETPSARLRVTDSALHGLSVLWEIAVYASDSLAADKAAVALVHLASRATGALTPPPNGGSSRGATWGAFADRCMTYAASALATDLALSGAATSSSKSNTLISGTSSAQAVRRVLKLHSSLSAALLKERESEAIAGGAAADAMIAEALAADEAVWPPLSPNAVIATAAARRYNSPSFVVPADHLDVPTSPDVIAASIVNARSTIYLSLRLYEGAYNSKQHEFSIIVRAHETLRAVRARLAEFLSLPCSHVLLYDESVSARTHRLPDAAILDSPLVINQRLVAFAWPTAIFSLNSATQQTDLLRAALECRIESDALGPSPVVRSHALIRAWASHCSPPLSFTAAQAAYSKHLVETEAAWSAPFVVLATSPAHFDLLLSLLSAHEPVIVADAWALLESLALPASVRDDVVLLRGRVVPGGGGKYRRCSYHNSMDRGY